LIKEWIYVNDPIKGKSIPALVMSYFPTSSVRS
jgi:hypothetical protein